MGAVVLRTDLVERDGTPIYRLIDRLNLDVPGLGSARMRVEADVTADMTPLRVVLETEEPRGRGVLSRELVVLERTGDGWVRSVTEGYGEPQVERIELPARAIVLTPPLGCGERLARLAPAEVGARWKVPAYDLETGLNTSWRLSAEDHVPVGLKGPPASEVQAVRWERREGPARLEVWRERTTGAPPLLIRRAQEGGRLVLIDPRVVLSVEAGEGPVAHVLALLRAAAAGDRTALKAGLDLDALYADGGGAKEDPKRRAGFEEALLSRLTDPQWLEERGLLLVAGAAARGDFTAQPPAEGVVRVTVGREGPTFALRQVEEGWKVVRLPRKP